MRNEIFVCKNEKTIVYFSKPKIRTGFIFLQSGEKRELITFLKNFLSNDKAVLQVFIYERVYIKISILFKSRLVIVLVAPSVCDN